MCVCMACFVVPQTASLCQFESHSQSISSNPLCNSKVFVGLCVAIQQLRAFGRTDTMDVVQLMRRGRNGMVVTSQECQLLHELIGDYAASLVPPNRQAESRL